jgi:mannose-6-phosphate isomerase-like protein (cupin superfamily)
MTQEARAVTTERSIPTVGDYQILQDFECPSASVRVFAMPAGLGAVGSHIHRRSMQIYVALQGAVAVEIDGTERTLLPYEAMAVWPGSTHRASPIDGDVVLLNISIPPLAADDQLAVSAEPEHNDLRLPRSGDDLED